MVAAARLTGAGKQCLVGVRGDTVGSGFFAAPGFVVTCAHVAGATAGSVVKVTWSEGEWEGRILAASPAPPRGGLWPYPDLAILKLKDPPPEHPCVWWHDRIPDGGNRLTAIGLSDKYRPRPEPVTADFEYQGVQMLDGGSMLRLKQDEVTNGMSGGPVLDLSNGGVCAVIKATRSPDTDMGGLATPIGALRLLNPSAYRALTQAHDSFHSRSTGWPDPAPQSAVKPDTMPPRLLRKLFSLLGALPLPARDALAAGFRQAADRYTSAPELPLLEHRDVVNELEALVLSKRTPRAMRYAATIAVQERAVPGAPELQAWLHTLNDALEFDLGELNGASSPPPPEVVQRSVMVRLRPSVVERDHYHLALWRYEGPDAISPVAAETPALPLDEAMELARQQLPAQIALLRGSGSGNVMVELIVPQQLMEEDFDGWRLWPQRSWSALGRKNSVVVRDLERFEDEELHPVWRERWNRFTALAAADRSVVRLACDGHRVDHEMLEGWMEAAPDLAALVLAGSLQLPTSTAALEVALSCGIPVVLWRRSHLKGCGDAPATEGVAAKADPRTCFGCEGQGSCAPAEVFGALRRDLEAAPLAQWPNEVRLLRGKAAAARPEIQHHARDLVLLWDDPERRLPDTPLHYA